uniref:(northern house mosquito) hypothetical protein n=1 Tax=Culex pipiens TaxID=7175 RepID=A0A8D8FQN9_CULPI
MPSEIFHLRSPEAAHANPHRGKTVQMCLLRPGVRPKRRFGQAQQDPRRTESVRVRPVRRGLPADDRAAEPLQGALPAGRSKRSQRNQRAGQEARKQSRQGAGRVHQYGHAESTV